MNPESIEIQLRPAGKTLRVPPGVSLQDILFAEGVEFPCGGRGRCKGCRVKVLSGDLPITSDDRHLLSPAELEQGWRLSCRARPEQNLTLELAQWEAAILGDNRPFSFTPSAGYGVAIDLGTTTIVAQLLDLQTSHVLAVRLALNRQAKHGADVMSRIQYAMAEPGQSVLQQLVREQLGAMIAELARQAAIVPEAIRRVVIVGNTVMHHLFCGITVEPLSHHPFEPLDPGRQSFAASDLGWSCGSGTRVVFLPCLGGFVGSDILAGILATDLATSERLHLLIDLGTNGEIVVGTRARLLCASTAAGPAFEGARIAMGMRAATGAISAVTIHEAALRCQVLGHTEPRGLCGSGLVDAVAAGLDLGWIRSTGKIAVTAPIILAAPVTLAQGDVRELQLAKGAIAAGVELLLQRWGATADQVERVFLAGAFGNYINRASARRIGLLNFPLERIVPAGNTALLGAKLALFAAEGDLQVPELLARTEHVPLNEDPGFQDTFVEHLAFPEGNGNVRE